MMHVHKVGVVQTFIFVRIHDKTLVLFARPLVVIEVNCSPNPYLFPVKKKKKERGRKKTHQLVFV